MSKKALLMILDGWGIGDQGKDDVIFNTPTPYWDYLVKTYPHSQLQASGENVGLPDGQMGNSEVGHLNIGAGRVVYQDLVKINRACADNSILKNPEMEPKGYFYNFQDAISALEVGVIDLHDKIIVRDEHGERLETTAGRIIFNEAVRNALA